jgi:hypothetical protein
MATLPRLVNAWFPNFVDTMGGQANGMWTTGDQSDSGLGPFSDLATATQSLTVSGLFAAISQTRSLVSASPVTGPYGTVTDQVVFVVQASGSSSGQIAIPAPVANIFLSDNVTVDLTNSLVQDWWGAVQGILGDSYGNAWTDLIYGYRRKIDLMGT